VESREGKIYSNGVELAEALGISYDDFVKAIGAIARDEEVLALVNSLANQACNLANIAGISREVAVAILAVYISAHIGH